MRNKMLDTEKTGSQHARLDVQMLEPSWKKKGVTKGEVKMFAFQFYNVPKGLSHITFAEPMFMKCILSVSDLAVL